MTSKSVTDTVQQLCSDHEKAIPTIYIIHCSQGGPHSHNPPAAEFATYG